ncbi:unnamed protein product [Nyctereutes procyonoides]|uniref:(raccoon dog) hypothetical protein n=1 Tax=Nyctereutes procyonoides TaxID=34880 RepID=A0A811YAK1_NYCPR|nr:unnamed protein product [Nyctereutes procyonoides]
MNWRERRAGSALGMLETPHVKSILDAAAILGEPVMLRAQTCPAGPQSSPEQGLPRADPPAWLLRACLTRQMCSHSIGMENLAQGRTPPHHLDLAGSLRAEKIEYQVTLEELQNLSVLFQEYEKRGRQLLDMETFKCIMQQSMRSQNKNTEQIEQLFMKIDYESMGRIQWDGFCTYLQLEYSEQVDALAQEKEVSFQLPAVLQGLSYGGPVLRILSMPDDTIIMIREDGAIYFWSLQLKLKRRKRVFLYEFSNLEPYCQISGLEGDPDKCLILYGDDQMGGCMNILSLASVGELTWKKLPKIENMPNININNAVTSPNVNYIRRKVHGDWITQLNYYDSIKAVISSSNHEPTALVIGESLLGRLKEEGKKKTSIPWFAQRRAGCDQTVFHIYKGVKAFSFCKRRNLLLTGGMDRIIRVWNPYLPGKPTGMLKSHMAPVVYIHVSAEDSKIFSMSTDNTIKIWDLETDSCLLTTSSKASSIKGDFAACLYLPLSRALCVATDTVVLLHLRLRSPPEPYLAVCHQEPMLCCRYNPAFRQVVSCSEASVVKVWDFETGKLLITGARDGCLKIWSYNNGRCLHTLKHDEKQSEVCDCTYLEVNQNKCIIAVGWDKRINVYFDAPCDFHHFWKPQPHWQDDLKHGHREDILCVAQYPPFLLATSRYDGEIIIWNVIPGHMYCKLNTPSPSDGAEDRKCPDRSVSCLAFLKTRAAKFESAAASLITNGPEGSVTFWKLFSGACPIANFIPSKDKAQVSSIAVTAGDVLVYVANQKGFVHVYDIKEYGLQGPELQFPKNVMVWRAHVSVVTSLGASILSFYLITLELVEEKFLLSSSLDRTVCLWSRNGGVHRSVSVLCLFFSILPGTFGQHSPRDIFTPASWSHPRVPYEILTDPRSMPALPVLEQDVAAMHTEEEGQENVVVEEFKTPNSCSLEEPILEALWCHQVACVSAVGEKPDLSIIGSDLFNLNFLARGKERSEASQKEH